MMDKLLMPLKNVAHLLQRGNNNLDLIRILAALMVIWSHAYAINNSQHLTEPFSRLTGTETGGSIAVAIFFFVSGMLVTNSILTKRSINEFILSRLFRIIPALFFLLVISAIIIGPVTTSLTSNNYFSSPQWHQYITKNLLMDTQFSLPGVFEKNAYPNSVNGSLWTIRYEMICYISLSCLFILRLTKSKILNTILCLLVIIAPAIPILKNIIPIYNFPYIVVMFSCFALGAIYAIHKNSVCVTLFIPAGLLLLHFATEKYFPTLSKCFISFFFCTLALWFSSIGFVKKIHIKHDISYGIYLWGFLIQQLLSFYFNLHIYLSQISAIILSIMLGYFSSILIEIPAMNLCKKIIKSSRFKALHTGK